MSQQQPYSYITFAQTKQQLANRLYDSNMVFWQNAELGLYITEALRTWNALTSYWRGDFLFSTAAGQTWYDLTDQTQMPLTLRPYTVLDTDIYSMIQYRLLEPGTPPLTINSLQFTADDIVQAVQRRLNELLAITGCTITRSSVGAVNGRITLNDSVIDVRRIAYLYQFPVSPGVTQPQASVLFEDDTYAESSYNYYYTVTPAGIPLAYIQSTLPPINFDVDRPPAYAGSYELLTVNAGRTLDALVPGTLGMPDDWTHLLTWGALADLLGRESNAKDSFRAGYCETRYRMGLQLLQQAPALLALRLNNLVLQIDSTRAGDLYNNTWQNQAPAQPQFAYHAGLNLVALTPTPDLGGSLYGVGLYGVGAYASSVPYSLMATVVENAPIPATDGAFMQVGRDDLDCIIDYAQHLASFKMGGAEFAATTAHLKRFFAQAANYNSKLAEIAEYTSFLLGQSPRDDQMHPRYQPGEPAEVPLG